MTDKAWAKPVEMDRSSHTYREIIEQPAAWPRALAEARAQWHGVRDALGSRLDAPEIVFTGCGSSYYLSLAAAAQFRRKIARPVSVLASSELLLHSPVAFGAKRPYLLIAVSRSGETTEVIDALGFARSQHGAPVLAVSAYADKPLAMLGDARIVIEAGQEASVVMTKSYTSMLLALQTVAARLGGNPLDIALVDSQLDRLPGLLARLLPKYGPLAEHVGALPDIEKRIFLGSGPYYGLALEANLKMKEMAIVTSEVYHTLEYRHGPISIVDKNTLVVCFISDAGYDYEVALLPELKALGARLFVVCERANETITKNADFLVELSSGLDESTRAVLYLPFAHLIAYSCAVSRGETPDNPRNLGQVVKLR